MFDFELELKTCCYGHYTFFFFRYYTVNKGMFLFIYELLIIDFVRTDKCILNQAQCKLILFSGWADNHNINTTICVYM